MISASLSDSDSKIVIVHQHNSSSMLSFDRRIWLVVEGRLPETRHAANVRHPVSVSAKNSENSGNCIRHLTQDCLSDQLGLTGITDGNETAVHDNHTFTNLWR